MKETYLAMQPTQSWICWTFTFFYVVTLCFLGSMLHDGQAQKTLDSVGTRLCFGIKILSSVDTNTAVKLYVKNIKCWDACLCFKTQSEEMVPRRLPLLPNSSDTSNLNMTCMYNSQILSIAEVCRKVKCQSCIFWWLGAFWPVVDAGCLSGQGRNTKKRHQGAERALEGLYYVLSTYYCVVIRKTHIL